jgi:hypothetical protein
VVNSNRLDPVEMAAGGAELESNLQLRQISLRGWWLLRNKRGDPGLQRWELDTKQEAMPQSRWVR